MATESLRKPVVGFAFEGAAEPSRIVLRIGLVTMLLLVGSPPAVGQSVKEQYGDIFYVGQDGSVRPLTQGGGYGEPVLSPDHRTVGFIHKDGPSPDQYSELTSLWIADGPTGTIRKLIGPKPHDDPHRNFASFQRPIFSLDGHFIYLSADAWVTSAAVHQVSIETGEERFVIDGSATAVIRTGPHRGYLLVSRHLYYQPPKSGSYDPVYVVRPDGKALFPVPGSEKAYGENAVGPWLRSKGWKAW